MRVIFDWGNINRLTVDAEDHELAECARFISNICEKRGPELIQLRVLDTPEMRRLFEVHLCNLKFARVESRESVEGPVVEVSLIYKKVGWTLGPKTENGAADG